MGKRSKCRSKSCVRARKRRQRHLTAPGTSPSEIPKLRECSLFEKYFYIQQWLPPCDNASFFATLRKPPPVTFRIRDEATFHEWQNKFLKQPNFHRLVKKIPVHLPVSDPRHDTNSNSSSWTVSSSWQVLPFALDDYNFRSWLSDKTKTGLISRQEFVSMIPVFLLGIQAQHRVLDLCSSPGSKTIQALDSLYQGHESSSTTTTKITSPPSGFVIANEIDPPRAYILAHRCRQTLSYRIQSLAITCHNACKFPDVLAPLHHQEDDQPSSIPIEQRQSFLFDRIICDVPCSGDGTLRKDFKVWKTWHPSYGIELHSLQIRIAKRGIALLKIGGLMTYSTCSFHPIENEAVVSALLQTGCVEVVSRVIIESILTGIKYREGLSSWKVLGDQCEELTKGGEHPPYTKKTLPHSLWPPSPDIERYDYIKESLRRCIRMVPHDNDTGGFFIALLRKVKDFPHTSNSSASGRKAMVTPKAAHHHLYPVPQGGSTNEYGEESTPKPSDEDQLTIFTRSPKGNGKQFKISESLSNYMVNSPGSSKLNFVYSGHVSKRYVIIILLLQLENAYFLKK